MGAPLLKKTVSEIWTEAFWFNLMLNIPVRWRRAERIAASSKRNMWMGIKEHVLLLEDLVDGRIKRKRGEFLCGARIANPQVHERLNVVDIDAEKTKRVAVNCEKCLEIAKRWQQGR